MLAIQTILLCLIPLTMTQRPPPRGGFHPRGFPPPRFGGPHPFQGQQGGLPGGGQNEPQGGFEFQGFQSGRQTGGMRPNNGGVRNGPTNINSINTDLEDGSGTCSTFGQYNRQTALIWEVLGGRNYTALEQLASTVIQQSWLSVEEPRPTPNTVCESYSLMALPLSPQKRQQFREHRMGAVGVGISGAYMYNHKSAEPTCNVAALIEKPTFDPCDGHADPSCKYHYHKAPVCIKGWGNCELMGYMIDGFPVYGKCTIRVNDQVIEMTSKYQKTNGQSGCDASHYEYQANGSGTLDQANGFYFSTDGQAVNGNTRFPAGTYAYFFTPEYPFIMPGYFGAYNQGLCEFDVSQFSRRG